MKPAGAGEQKKLSKKCVYLIAIQKNIPLIAPENHNNVELVVKSVLYG